jgi:hypothetical protein
MLTPSIGATGLLALVVIMILTGRLVPKSMFEDLRADKDQQIEIWRSAYAASTSAQDVQREQISALLEAAKTATSVIQALPHSNEGGSRRALADPDE